jgi:hypothetical protein
VHNRFRNFVRAIKQTLLLTLGHLDPGLSMLELGQYRVHYVLLERFEGRRLPGTRFERRS